MGSISNGRLSQMGSISNGRLSQMGSISNGIYLKWDSVQLGLISTGKDEDRVENAYHQLNLIAGLILFLCHQNFTSATASRRDSYL
jgi:hypothetical protein